MTYLGNFAISPQTVKIPTLGVRSLSSITVPYVAEGTDLYWDSENLYMNSAGSFYHGKLSAPTSLYHSASAAIRASSTNTDLTSICPFLIGDYFYSFGTYTSIFSGGGTRVYRAHRDTPYMFLDTGADLPNGVTRPFYYNDGTYLWIIDTGNVQRAAIADLTGSTINSSMFTFVAALPVAMHTSASFAVVGSTIYAYGGHNADADTFSNKIYSATAATMNDWADTGATLPAANYSAAVYNDGTYLWFIGGQSDTGPDGNIRRATVAAPTVVTNVGTIPGGTSVDRGAFFQSGNRLYLASSSFIYASTSDLTTWTAASTSLPTAVANAHVIKTDTHMYVIGGRDSAGTAQTTIQYAETSAPNIWYTSANTLPAGLAGGEIIKTSSYYYLIGGNGTTGSYYRASLADPTTWTLVSTNGPKRSFGKALIYQDYVWYFSGETADNSTAMTLGIYGNATSRAPIVNGTVIDTEWIHSHGGDSVYFPGLIAELSRYSLFVVGDFAYALGGYSGGSGTTTVNTTLYRARLDRLIASVGSPGALAPWTSVGTLSAGVIDASVAIINNTLYVIGGTAGGSSGVTTTAPTHYIWQADLNRLASGGSATDFKGIDSMVYPGVAGHCVTCVNGEVYCIGGRIQTTSTTNASTQVLRTSSFDLHVLTMPELSEANVSIPTISLSSGALGSYTTFQQTGMLPWLMTDS